MATINRGDLPAFAYGNHVQGGDPGMSRREYFAGLAMQGLLAPGARMGADRFEDIAVLAVEHADALIAALATRKTEGA